MNTILVPTDDSAAAGKALDVALDLAEKHAAHIKLLHVLLRDKEPDELLRLPDIATDKKAASQLQDLAAGPKTQRSVEGLLANPNAPDRPVPDPLLRTIGAHVLERASRQSKTRGVAFEVLEISGDTAAKAIAAAAEEHGIDTIVMGMRGLRQIEAFTFGSVSQQVCSLVSCTCVAVH